MNPKPRPPTNHTTIPKSPDPIPPIPLKPLITHAHPHHHHHYPHTCQENPRAIRSLDIAVAHLEAIADFHAPKSPEPVLQMQQQKSPAPVVNKIVSRFVGRGVGGGKEKDGGVSGSGGGMPVLKSALKMAGRGWRAGGSNKKVVVVDANANEGCDDCVGGGSSKMDPV
ncbi:hypothetical protein HDU76_012270, partial [Blyttiomyces sp. JEL0837]